MNVLLRHTFSSKAYNIAYRLQHVYISAFLLITLEYLAQHAISSPAALNHYYVYRRVEKHRQHQQQQKQQQRKIRTENLNIKRNSFSQVLAAMLITYNISAIQSKSRPYFCTLFIGIFTHSRLLLHYLALSLLKKALLCLEFSHGLKHQRGSQCSILITLIAVCSSLTNVQYL